MTKEEFIKSAENFELHKRLINFHLCDRENKNYSNDLKQFAEKQVVDGNLLLSLMEYAEEYHQERLKLDQRSDKKSVCEHPYEFVSGLKMDIRTCHKCGKTPL